MLSTGRVGLEEKSPIHVADVMRIMSETNPAKSGSGDLVSTRGDQTRGDRNGSSIKNSNADALTELFYLVVLHLQISSRRRLGSEV